MQAAEKQFLGMEISLCCLYIMRSARGLFRAHYTASWKRMQAGCKGKLEQECRLGRVSRAPLPPVSLCQLQKAVSDPIENTPYTESYTYSRC